MRISETDLAWAAGLFEGEGSVRINSVTQRNLGALLVDMVNTDHALVAFFQARWPGYFRMLRPAGVRREFWRWRIASWVAADFLRAIRPFVRGAKLERIELGLAYQSQKTTDTRINRTPEYRERQREFFERMKALNLRGTPLGDQLRLIPDNKGSETA